MKRRNFLRSLSGAALSSAGILHYGFAKTVETGRIVLGQSAAISGPASELGRQYREGALCCFDSVNATGGIRGRQIELRTLDDAYDPGRCADNTSRFLEDPEVLALFGYVGTETSMAAMRIANTAKKLFFAPFSGSETLRIPYSPYVFHVRASYVDETTAIINHLTSVGIKHIGIFYQNDSEGKAGLLGVGRALKQRYLAPRGIGKVEPNSTDVEAAVRVIAAEKPDAVVQISTYRSCAAFIRSARQAGYEGMFCNISSVGTQALVRELPSSLRGIMVSQVMPYPFAGTSLLAKQYLAAGKSVLKEKFEPSYSGIEGYVAASTLVHALKSVGDNVTQAAVINSLESMNEFELYGFPLSFSSKNHTASRMVELTILTADGKIRH